ncbi:glycosyltransferase [Pseudomonas turukhanskensis]|nr:glycosyltransferase [Pseudomonas turukhanskensis]
MAVKNEARYIEGALASISFASDFEVVLVDDGSDDGTPDIVEALDLAHVKLIRTTGIGKARAFSTAYEHASGSYFVLFAGDDVIQSDVLARRIAPLKASSIEGPAVTFCKLKSFSEQGRYDGMELPKHPARGLESGGCIAFNRAFGDIAFPIPPTLANEDNWLMLHVRFSGVHIEHVPEVGLLYRIHENNSYKRGVSFAQVNEQMWMRQRALFFFYEQRRGFLTQAQQRQVLMEFALQLLRYLGKPVLLMLLWELSVRARVKVLFNSRASLYWVRERFYKFFSGR